MTSIRDLRERFPEAFPQPPAPEPEPLSRPIIGPHRSEEMMVDAMMAKRLALRDQAWAVAQPPDRDAIANARAVLKNAAGATRHGLR